MLSKIEARAFLCCREACLKQFPKMLLEAV